MKWLDNAKKIAYLCAVLILVLMMIFSGLRILESAGFLYNRNAEDSRPSKTIIRDGVAYFPRQDITVVMLLGIDEAGPVTPSDSYNNSGAADLISLLIFDEQAKAMKLLSLNRDTMLDMPVLGLGGAEAGSARQQLALAHTYGKGVEDSCMNTRKAVSNFLYGLSIDHYISMNMDAIALLNDAVGGVSVTVTDDFSAVDPTISMGQVKLSGPQAVNFVRSRSNLGDQTNLSRMERQKQYMSGFLTAFQDMQDQDNGFMTRIYEDVSDYVVTDMSLQAISGILKQYGDYPLEEVITPEGELVMGNRYLEFHADEQKLDSLILELFYAVKK